jgi:HSP20 family protein
MSNQPETEEKHSHPASRLARWWASEVRQLDAPYPWDDRIKVEQRTKGDRLEVHAEIPGVDPRQDIKVSLGDGFLRLDAHRHKETEVESWTHVASEFQYGSASRVVGVPRGVTPEDVTARYRNGVLTIEVKLPDELDTSTAQEIPITME